MGDVRPDGRSTWDAGHTEQLKVLLADKRLSTAEIAERLGTTRNAVIGKVNRMRREAFKGLALSGRRRTRAERIKAAAAKPMPVPPPPPPPEPAPEPEPDESNPVTLVELTATTCRWPLFKGREPVHQQFYCGAMPLPGRPYCGPHTRKAYSKAQRPEGAQG
jgi:GcrA cell cycle regulator